MHPQDDSVSVDKLVRAVWALTLSNYALVIAGVALVGFLLVPFYRLEVLPEDVLEQVEFNNELIQSMISDRR